MRLRFFTLVSATLALLPGCGVQSGSGNEARVGALEAQILDVARAAQADCEDADNSPGVRERLDPLVRDLLTLVPDRPEGEDLPAVTGPWQQVWPDFPTPAF